MTNEAPQPHRRAAGPLPIHPLALTALLATGCGLWPGGGPQQVLQIMHLEVPTATSFIQGDLGHPVTVTGCSGIRVIAMRWPVSGASGADAAAFWEAGGQAAGIDVTTSDGSTAIDCHGQTGTWLVTTVSSEATPDRLSSLEADLQAPGRLQLDSDHRVLGGLLPPVSTQSPRDRVRVLQPVLPGEVQP